MGDHVVISEKLLERIDFIQLSVSDLHRSVSWYEKHFGFKKDFLNENLAVLMPPTPIPTGLPTLLLNKAGNNPNWFESNLGKSSTVGFHTKNVQKLYEYFKEQQVEVSEISDGGFAYFMSFYDLDSNMFEVIQLK